MEMLSKPLKIGMIVLAAAAAAGAVLLAVVFFAIPAFCGGDRSASGCVAEPRPVADATQALKDERPAPAVIFPVSRLTEATPSSVRKPIAVDETLRTAVIPAETRLAVRTVKAIPITAAFLQEPVVPAQEPVEVEKPVETAAVEAVAEPVVAPEVQVAPEPEGKVMTVGSSGVNVRSAAGMKSDVLFSLAGGKKVNVSGEDKGWLKLTDEDGRTGWAYSELLK